MTIHPWVWHDEQPQTLSADTSQIEKGMTIIPAPMVENLFNILLSSTGENIGEYKQHTKAENWNVNAVYP